MSDIGRKNRSDRTAVSMGGSNELVECFCGGAVAEGGSGAVAQVVGDGVEVGLVAGDASMLRRPLIWRGVRPCDKSKITRRRRTSSRSRSRFLGRRLAICAALPASSAWYTPPGPRWRVISRHTTEGLRPIERAIRACDKPASNPTIIAAQSSTLNIRRQLTTSPSNSTATTQIAYTL